MSVRTYPAWSVERRDDLARPGLRIPRASSLKPGEDRAGPGSAGARRGPLHLGGPAQPDLQQEHGPELKPVVPATLSVFLEEVPDDRGVRSSTRPSPNTCSWNSGMRGPANQDRNGTENPDFFRAMRLGGSRGATASFKMCFDARRECISGRWGVRRRTR